MSLGFEKTGAFETILAVDNDPASVQTYNLNFGHTAICADITQLTDYPKADIIIGGPPCQGFSQLGKQELADPRNKLWTYYLSAVAKARPKVFVIENVPPLLKSKEFEKLKQLAKNLGYALVFDVLNSADYGVPQKRKRAIIIGSRIGEPKLPKPTHGDLKKLEIFTGELRPWTTIREAISDLPLEPSEKNLHIGRNPTKKSLQRYKHIPPGGNRFNLPKELTPKCWIKKTKGGTDLFGRLRWEGQAYTIRTEFFKPEKGCYLHPEAHRPITHREAARFQTFPDDFVFAGSNTQIARQIGNAVPPLFAKNVALAVLDLLEKEPEETFLTENARVTA